MLRYLKSWLRGMEMRLFNRRIQAAMKLHLRGEVRADGLPLKSARSSLQLEWRARDIHPWDRALCPKNSSAQFVNQAITDTVAALSRLFASLPHVDTIAIRVYEPCFKELAQNRQVEAARIPDFVSRHECALCASDRLIMSGEVSRSDMVAPRPLSDRMWLGQLGVRFHIIDNSFQPLSREEDQPPRRFKPHSIENHCT